jgi:RNA polymerase sigma-70 factor (ECF subfamily)
MSSPPPPPERRGPLSAPELKRLHGDDGPFFDSLWREHEPGVRRVASRLAQDRADADELIQLVRIRAWEGRETYDGRGTFAAWLAKVVVNQARDVARRRSTEVQRHRKLVADYQVFSEATPPDEHEAWEEMREFRIGEVRRVLDELPAREREMALMRYTEDQKPAAIAKAMGMQPNSVYSRLWELGEKLRESLGGLIRGGRDQNVRVV